MKNKQWYLKNLEKVKARSREWSLKNAEYLRQWRQALKSEVFEKYGNKCNCCGEQELDFLVIDHVLNDGNVERKKHGLVAYQLFRHIKKSGYPDKYQLLCWNCNAAKAFRNGCPHKRNKPNHKEKTA